MNVGLFKRGSHARLARDEMWRDAYKRRDWTEARKESKSRGTGDEAMILFNGYTPEEKALLLKYSKLVKHWDRKEYLWAYLLDEAKETEPELRNEFWKEWEKDYPADYKGFRFANK